MTFQTIRSFTEIASRYDGFILDQFGVMHNGVHALPGAVECTETLTKMGKKLIILSNTSSTAKLALSKLPKMGFNPDIFQGVVTSGEEAGRYIRETYDQGSGSDVTTTTNNKTTKAVMFTWDASEAGPAKFLEKCGGNILPTTTVDEADFIITHGSSVLRNGNGGDGEDISLGSFFDDCDYSVIDPILAKCKEKDLPMVCANPDLIVKLPGDKTAYMPGNIAKRYEDIGGKCIYFGKPHAGHFKACLRDLGLDPNKVAHVGDSLHHDIAGANAAGIASVFITGGIHGDDFDGTKTGDLPPVDMLEDLFQKEGQTPTHVSPLFKF